MDAIPCLSHILLPAGFACYAIYEIVAFACYIAFAFILAAGLSACDRTRFIKHWAELAFEIPATILIFATWAAYVLRDLW